MRKILILTLALGLLMAPTVWADEITDQVQRGVKLYEDGKITEAIGEIEFALAQMRSQKGDALTKVFPEAPEGWKAKEPEVQSAGASLLGGGITATRDYVQKDGRGRMSIQIFTDSPLIQTMAMMINNPMMTGGKNSKPVRINGQKGVLQTKGKDRAELQLLVDGNILLKVDARKVENAAQMAQDMAKSVDLKKLRQLSK